MKGEEISLTGMVVSESPYSEDSAVCSLATSDGLVPLLLGHVYRPKSTLKPLLVVGSLVNVLAIRREKGPFVAKQAGISLDASPCLADLKGTAFLLLLKEAAQRLYQYGDKFPYQDVEILLKALMAGKDLLSLSLLLLGTLYQSLGIEVDTNACVFCKKKENIVSFSLKEGGYVCRDCLSRTGLKRKSDMELYVLKFAFMPINGKTIAKCVPALPGRSVLTQLCLGLSDYFDLHEFQCLPFLLEQCRMD